MTNEAGIDGACDRKVFRAFDDGTGIRKEGDFVIRCGDFEKIGVLGNFSLIAETFGKSVKVDGGVGMLWVDLNGIAAAKAEGTEGVFAIKVGELVIAAAGAAGFEGVKRHRVMAVAPEVEGVEGGILGVMVGGEVFESFDGGETAGGGDGGAEDADGIAGVGAAGGGEIV